MKQTKQCTVCKQIKSIDKFSKDKSKLDGYNYRCKECVRQYYQSLNYQPDPKLTEKECTVCKQVKSIDKFSKHKSTSDGYQCWCKECAFKSKLKRRYDLSRDQMKQMFVSQNGRCAICLQPFKSRNDIHIDHDHVTGKTRQLLCPQCNTGIGFFKDDIGVLKNAIDYLNKWSVANYSS